MSDFALHQLVNNRVGLKLVKILLKKSLLQSWGEVRGASATFCINHLLRARSNPSDALSGS